MAKLFAGISRPSLRQGLFVGILLGVVEIAYGFLVSVIIQASLQTLLSTIGLAIFVVFGFWAGWRASRETGKLGSGLLAGLLAGLLGAVLYQLIPFINGIVHLSDIVQYYQSIIRLNPAKYPGVKPSSFGTSDALINLAISLLSGVLTYALITFVGGAIGAFLGRRQALATQATGGYDEAMFVAPRPHNPVTDEARK